MQPKKRKNTMIYLLLLAGAPLMFSSCVTNLIFQPPAASYEPSVQLIKIPTANNQQIAAFYLPPQSESDFVILFSHGNAEDIGHNIEFARTAGSRASASSSMTTEAMVSATAGPPSKMRIRTSMPLINTLSPMRKSLRPASLRTAVPSAPARPHGWPRRILSAAWFSKAPLSPSIAS